MAIIDKRPSSETTSKEQANQPTLEEQGVCPDTAGFARDKALEVGELPAASGLRFTNSGYPDRLLRKFELSFNHSDHRPPGLNPMAWQRDRHHRHLRYQDRAV